MKEKVRHKAFILVTEKAIRKYTWILGAP